MEYPWAGCNIGTSPCIVGRLVERRDAVCERHAQSVAPANFSARCRSIAAGLNDSNMVRTFGFAIDEMHIHIYAKEHQNYPPRCRCYSGILFSPTPHTFAWPCITEIRLYANSPYKTLRSPVIRLAAFTATVSSIVAITVTGVRNASKINCSLFPSHFIFARFGKFWLISNHFFVLCCVPFG